MEFKHSPAPWRCHDKRPYCSGYSISGNDGRYIGFVGDSDGLSPCNANAHLIAAAPELLEALQEIVGNHYLSDKAQSMATKAIAKALGQQ
ncbi:TPA: hypothetical protein JAD51_000833 [Proteus mirabilis]|nr:hypothetical protein [Proteus mirabilis]